MLKHCSIIFNFLANFVSLLNIAKYWYHPHLLPWKLRTTYQFLKEYPCLFTCLCFTLPASICVLLHLDEFCLIFVLLAVLWNCWVYLLQRSKTIPSKKKRFILSMTLNCIWWWGSGSWVRKVPLHAYFQVQFDLEW